MEAEDEFRGTLYYSGNGTEHLKFGGSVAEM